MIVEVERCLIFTSDGVFRTPPIVQGCNSDFFLQNITGESIKVRRYVAPVSSSVECHQQQGRRTLQSCILFFIETTVELCQLELLLIKMYTYKYFLHPSYRSLTYLPPPLSLSYSTKYLTPELLNPDELSPPFLSSSPLT